jgi:5-methylcytosine-specific restriction endonuclease McrA
LALSQLTRWGFYFLLKGSAKMTEKEKRCTKCKIIKPFSEFYKLYCSSDGYQYHCKDCAKKYTQTPEAQEKQRQYRKTESRKRAQKKYANSEKGQHKRSTYRKMYNQTEKAKAAKKRYAESERGKRLKAAYSKEYAQREDVKAKHRAYKKSERGRQQSRRHTAIRRRRQVGAKGDYTATEWLNLCNFYGFHCLCCNNEFPFDKLTIDHVKPISKGGSNYIWNLQPLCLSCNSGKCDREIDYRISLPAWIKRDGPTYIQLPLIDV